MRVLIDACVLYPTVLRELVLGSASLGAFQPLWSERILAEWLSAGRKNNQLFEAQAEIDRVGRQFPDAVVPADPEIEMRLSLPDENDIHVLAAAIKGEAEELLTLNVKDFPPRTLAREGILLREPDGFLLEQFHLDQSGFRAIVASALDRANSHGIDTSKPRNLLKRARVPRLGKALYPS